MSQADINLPQPRRLGETSRADAWYMQPLAVFLGFTAFIVYATWAGTRADNFFANAAHPSVVVSGGTAVAHYLCPMYSPVLFDIPGLRSGHAWFGEAPTWLVDMFGWLPFGLTYSPAMLVLMAPAGFRFTCYYYRGAYYKAFWADPPNCAVGEPGFRGTRYRGEEKLPLILQNIHRFFLYLALGFVVVLSYDGVISYIYTVGAPGAEHKVFGVGVGSLIMTLNPILIAGYTFGCHSLRHLVGGKKDCIGSGNVRRTVYDCVSCFNRSHMKWAWVSLIWVGFTDLYVRMVASGVWTDYVLFHL